MSTPRPQHQFASDKFPSFHFIVYKYIFTHFEVPNLYLIKEKLQSGCSKLKSINRNDGLHLEYTTSLININFYFGDFGYNIETSDAVNRDLTCLSKLFEKSKRGSLAPTAFFQFILNMIFLKYISNSPGASDMNMIPISL